MFKKILSAYMVDYPKVLTYMWQQSEYEVARFVRWWRSVSDFRRVSYRGSIVSTSNSRNVRFVILAIALTYLSVNMLIIYSLHLPVWTKVVHGVCSVLLYPISVVIITMPVITLLRIIQRPLIRAKVKKGKEALASHSGIVIAVAGSYGKTSMKDMLAHLLDGSVKVAVTEGNQNTLLSQAIFATKLTGDEDVVIVEFGEGAPKDVTRMVELVQPDYAIITGLAPNHLDMYKTIEVLAEDFSALAEYVGRERTYMNADSSELIAHLGELGTVYSQHGFLGWQTSKTKVTLDGTSFVLTQKKEKIPLTTSLMGRHIVGPLSLASILAMELGVSRSRLIERVADLRPYEHRMQLRDLGGMWMIDDTYNGNIEGLVAGLTLLKELKVKGRKLYATPGLVDQGDRTTEVHARLGEAIADSGVDHVYLMKNSVTISIQQSMLSTGFEGKVTIVDDPLQFYTNIQDILAVGDVVMCQNDWPDSYS